MTNSRVNKTIKKAIDKVHPMHLPYKLNRRIGNKKQTNHQCIVIVFYQYIE